MSFNVIRLKPRGSRKYPVFDIIVISKLKKRRGTALEKIGFYNPNATEGQFFIDFYRLVFWLNKGAWLNYSVKKKLASFLFD